MSLLMFIFKSIRCFTDDHVTFIAQQLGESTSNSLLNAIYRKVLRMSNSSKHEYSTGSVMNIATTDASRFPWFYYYIETVIASMMTFAACLWFSCNLLGISALFGFSIILILVLPLSAACMIWEQKIEEIIEANQDERSQIISQMVYAMRFVKFYTMEKLFKRKIMNIREVEMKNIKKGYISDSGMSVLWNAFAPMISFVSFLHFCYVKGETLSVSTSFSFLSALDMIRYEVIYVPDSLLNISRACTSFKRIIKLLSSEEISESSTDSNNKEMENQKILEKDLVAEYANASFTWDSLKCESSPTITLKEINLKIKKGEFVCIIGRVGQSKSSLLSSLLGEMNFIESQDSFFEKDSNLKYSYVAQDSWIRNQTIRENILFGEEFDKERYQQVLHACNLEPDLQQISKEIGDMTMIGESGINLSGGQKLRISLARCFYSNADVFLLDDPLSAVDVHTADHIMKYGIYGFLKGKTTLMVTNQIHFIDKADRILVMDQGRIVQQGTFTELYQEDLNFKNLIDEFSSNNKNNQQEERDLFDEEEENIENQTSIELISHESLEEYSKIEEEQRKNPSTLDSMKRLFKFAVGNSKFMFALICFCAIIQQLVTVGHQYVLSLWSNDSEYQSFTLLTYLLAYLGTSLIYIVADISSGFLCLIHFLNTAKLLHEKLMTSIIHSCIAFFDSTPVGRIIARFTRDTNSIDTDLNKNLAQLIPYFFFWIGGIITVMIMSPYSIIPVVILSPVIFFVQSYYRVSLREIELLAGVYSSPVNSQLSETIHGLQTIRAFGKQNLLVESFIEKAETQARVSYNSHCLSAYFNMRNEVVFALCVSLIIISSVLSFSGSLVGVIILQATLSFDSLYYISYLFVMIEKYIVSVERIEQYSELESEKYEPNVQVDMKEFGNGGQIEMKNVCMRYKKHTFETEPAEQNKLVLKGINLKINAKERVSICGRTGSGKSSLIQSLMRMQEIEQESTILIDGIDIRNVPLETLRSTMCIIPQQPTLFKGTLRENLDSYSQYTDRELWDALEKVGMKDKLDQLQSLDDEDEEKSEKEVITIKPTGLETEISENGENISAGTRQLLCLARALIRKSKILILDEATALCDLETDKLIQKTLREEFSSNCTVICVAHRLETILDYDKIVVIDDGLVREIGSPSELLADSSSLFYQMVEKHNKRK
ncbi:predicted protein [Naegleria gruberi]|uniref:Predicted protein n=1 Tax=Naegleria gruberi TaxID=5762 RepID=D2VVX5_NAEGR|nr:uncharacterized protein NAEGRDRAFT_73174 [Naegleria gruberi]EFC38918.1 predicted protein [Naegleria gruberi]|eukprot:XP_002671662.1 predicted protein [Naegleria gruberi strain NEG-M]